MEYLNSAPVTTSDGNYREQQFSNIEQKVIEERLRLVAEQAGVTLVMAALALAGFGLLYGYLLDTLLLFTTAAIATVYILRLWLGWKFLSLPAPSNNQQDWLNGFIITAGLSGLFWGIAVAQLTYRNSNGDEFALVILVSTLTAGSILSIGSIFRAYVWFILGLLLPISIAYLVRSSSIDLTIWWLILAYSIFLIVTLRNHNQRLDSWLCSLAENSNLIEYLNDEKVLSDENLVTLTATNNQYRKSLLETEQRSDMLAKLLEDLPGLTYHAINDGKWTIKSLSNGCQELLGFTEDQLAHDDKLYLSLLFVDAEKGFTAGTINSDNVRVNGKGVKFQLEYRLLAPSGKIRSVREYGCRNFNDKGKLIAIDGFVLDLTEPYQLSKELLHRESHDSLTGLLNRYEFEKIAQKAIQITTTAQTTIACLHIGIDQFKLVNDTCGHDIGDKLLQQVGELLNSRLRKHDTLARLGGDEFGVLLKNCRIDEAIRIAGDLCKSIGQHQFGCKNRTFNLTVSIGLSSSEQEIYTLQTLMSAADSASIAAKESGRNRVQLYHWDDHFLQRRNEEMRWAFEIPEAIAEDRLYLERQLIVPGADIQDSKTWYEVLVRMHDREGNVVMPGEFLSAAERYNLAVTIDTWVVKTIITKLDAEPALLEDLGLCFINISGQSLGQPTFHEFICTLLEQTQVPANRLCFEITETTAVANIDQALIMMERLQKLGCRFALDDFGSGLSSFGYLKCFPTEFIKIDGSFVKNLIEDPINRSIVTSITDIGHATGKQVIAEFVENDEIMEYLQEIGVDYAQGYGISRPDPFPQCSPSELKLVEST